MNFAPFTLDDIWLYERLRCDPVMMTELGGPQAREGIKAKLKQDIASFEAGLEWNYKIIPDIASNTPAGQVVIWQNQHKGETINEIGWMILPKFQGKGLATKAVQAMLDKARSEKRWDVVHAFPAISNKASNAICHKTGFSLIETCELNWGGNVLNCNHWQIELMVQSSLSSVA